MTKIFKKKKLCKKYKEKIKKEESQQTQTNNKINHTENKYVQTKLFNMSNTTLSKCQTSILLRGLEFTSILKINSIKLTCDLKTFVHKLRLIGYSITTLRQLIK